MKSELRLKFPDLRSALKDHMGKALEKSFICMKGAGLPVWMWFEKHQSYLHLVADEPAIRSCVQTKDSWEGVASELQSACTSRCGMRIFGGKLGVVACIAVSKKIDIELDAFCRGPMTEATLKQALLRMQECCKEMGKEWTSARSADSKIMYKYRGVECYTRAHSHQQEAMVKLMAAVKTRAITNKLLDSIWCEDQLVDVGDPDGLQVEDSLLTDAKLARKAAAELISGGSGSEIKKCSDDRNKLLLGLDRHRGVDRDFWLSMGGKPGEDRVKALLLRALPTAEGGRTVHRWRRMCR